MKKSKERIKKGGKIKENANKWGQIEHHVPLAWSLVPSHLCYDKALVDEEESVFNKMLTQMRSLPLWWHRYECDLTLVVTQVE